MNCWKDPFSKTPQGFHNRVEQTLGGLEDMNMKHNYRRISTILVAALIAILIASAAAAVLGNARFKQALIDSGADEVAALVQEVHVSAKDDEADGFALSIDEIIWVDDQLYFSYTASVPDDGNRYLLALYTPLLNGEPMEVNAKGWEDSTFFDGKTQIVIPLGGAQPASCGQLLTFKVDPLLRQKAANALFLRADFFKTDIDFTENMSGFDTRFKNAVPTVCLVPDKREDFFEDYSGRTELPAAELEALRAIEKAVGEDGILTPDELTGTDFFEDAARREVRMALDASQLEQTVYDDVEETEFELNGCKVSVEDFRMTHLGASMSLRVTAPSGLSEEEGMRLTDSVVNPQRNNRQGIYIYSWNLFRTDGSELALEQDDYAGSAGYQPLPDGTASYAFGFDIDGVILLNGLEKVVLMPYTYYYDENDVITYDYMTDMAIELTPILRKAQVDTEPIQTLSSEEQAAFDCTMNGDIMTRLERKTAAANWQEGSSGVTVYATEGGRFYHIDIECSGMCNAFPWKIEDAEKAGKKPCPNCIGGPNAPDETDITMDDFLSQ